MGKKVVADLIGEGYRVAITHSNAPQVGMIHAAMNGFAKNHQEYTKLRLTLCRRLSEERQGSIS